MHKTVRKKERRREIDKHREEKLPKEGLIKRTTNTRVAAVCRKEQFINTKKREEGCGAIGRVAVWKPERFEVQVPTTIFCLHHFREHIPAYTEVLHRKDDLNNKIPL